MKKPTIDDLPTFERQLAQPEKETEDAEIWFPSWRCFCCHDSGLVSPPLVSLIIPDYDHLRDKSPVCQRCPMGDARLITPDIYDLRFTRKICDRLDRFERHDWTETVKTKQKRIVELKQLADKLAMPGSRDRTANDEREVQQRKQEVEAISHEEWLSMAAQHSGGDDQDSSIAM